MAQTPPFRSRPRLHIELAKLTGSPGYPGQSNPTNSSLSTPRNVTIYSPFRSAGIKPPAPHEEPIQFAQGRSLRPGHYFKYSWCRLKRLALSRILWLILAIGMSLLWWFSGGRDELDLVKLGSNRLSHDLFQEERTRNLHFIPASNPKIHYVGRWISSPNRLRKDGVFPGVYFDIIVTNTTTLLLSLRNTAKDLPEFSDVTTPSSAALNSAPKPSVIHVPFRPMSSKEKPSPPVSLLARVDQEEYILLLNATALVLVCNKSLNQNEEHRIRIVAPMADDRGQGVIELEGLWLDVGGKLSRVEGSLLGKEYEDEDALSAENDQIGEKHRAGLHGLLEHKKHIQDGRENDEDSTDTFQSGRKILEVITDSPNFYIAKQRNSRTGGAHGLLAGVMGWEYLLGEMFEADHVSIGVDGMCLTRDCIGGVGQPTGIGDAFFRSGPVGTPYFDHTWMFDIYIPDAIIMDIGTSDALSYELYSSAYNCSIEELHKRFENTYMSLIKAVRLQAYPQHPSIVHDQRSDHSAYISSNPSVLIPIFIMRPLRGQLEHVTQNVVSKLRADGDKSIFWLDTSGWVEVDESSKLGDFFADETVTPSKWRLTEQGNQRVAIFLHSHLCRYLAREEETCPFLPHEVYQGKVFDPEEASFNHYLESEKERKLKKLFWEDDIGGDSRQAFAELDNL